MVVLRPAVEDDIPAVLAFWLDATAEPSSTDDAAAITALFARSPGSMILAVDGDAIVGSVVAGWDGWRGSIYRLAVAPKHRRRGIATRLVTAAEEYLRAQGVRRMHLIVSIAGGDAAVDFWKSANYEPTPQMRMVKSL